MNNETIHSKYIFIHDAWPVSSVACFRIACHVSEEDLVGMSPVVSSMKRLGVFPSSRQGSAGHVPSRKIRLPELRPLFQTIVCIFDFLVTHTRTVFFEFW
jgi:hypothetical protein